MRTVDCEYAISDERLREYAKIPEFECLRWLDERVRFTLMARGTKRITGKPSDWKQLRGVFRPAAAKQDKFS
jgi:hypothetical protein